ncbi:MAG: helix-turn-helix domain-containing protein [Candidatus Thermoplasmatota archaeon]
MTILFGTLGWRPQSLMPSIKSTAELERVAFYHSSHEKSRTARAKVMDFCNTLGIPATAVELSDAFNLLEIARRIREDVVKARTGSPTSVRFNIAGGTRLMSSAALLVCILEGIPTTYVHDETYEEIQLPLLKMNYAERLSAKQREILAYLVAHREKPMTETGLAKALGVHKSTMNHHVHQLRARGVVEVGPNPKDSRAHWVRAAPAADLLVG